MRIDQIVYENFGPFAGIQTLDLAAGLHMFVGPNGAGKSAACLAIPYVLYGTIPGMTPEKLVHDGAARMSVRLRLSDGTDITRGWDCAGKGAGFVEMNGTEDARAADMIRAFVERSGLTAADFRSTVFLGMGDPGLLVTATPAERRDQLGAWVVPALWGELAAKAAVKSKALQGHIQAAQAALRGLAPELPAELEERLTVAERARNEAAKLIASPEAVRATEIQKRRARDIRQRAREMATLLAEEPPLPGTIPALSAPPVEPALPAAPDPPVAPDPPNAPEEPIVDEGAEMADRDKLARWRGQLVKTERLAQGEFAGPCPVDGVECPRATEIRDDLDRYKCKVATQRKLISELASEVQADDDKLAAHQRAERLHRDAMEAHRRSHQAALDAHRRDHERAVEAHRRDYQSALEAHERAHRDALAAYERAHHAHDAWWLRVERLLDAAPIPDVDVATLRRTFGDQPDLSGFDREIGELHSRIARARIDADRVAELDAELKALEPQLIAWRWMERACGREGVPAMLLDSAIGEIADEGNRILAEAGASLRFEFRLRKQLKKPADRCRCGYVFPPRKKKCDDCGERRGLQVDHDCMPMVRDAITGDVVRAWRSSGQQAMLAVGLRIGAAAWRRRRTGCPWSTLILDEVEGPLSDENAAACREVVRAAPALGFGQQLMVSHRAASRLAGQRVIRVIPEGGCSRLVID